MGTPSGTAGTAITLADLLLPRAWIHTQTCMTHRDISRRFLVYAEGFSWQDTHFLYFTSQIQHSFS